MNFGGVAVTSENSAMFCARLGSSLSIRFKTLYWFVSRKNKIMQPETITASTKTLLAKGGRGGLIRSLRKAKSN